MPVILILLKIVGASLVWLGVSAITVFALMGDISPHEGPFERFLFLSFFYFLGGLYIGYLLPRLWFLSLALALPTLFEIPGIHLFTESEGTARLIVINVHILSPVVALLAGYVGHRIHRHANQVPPQDRNMPLRYVIGLVLAVPPLFFTYMFATQFFVKDEPGRVFIGDPPYMMSAPTELHSAAEEGDLEEIVRLIKLGADVNARDMAGRTPLHYAVGQEQTAAVELLLSFDASPDIPDREYSVTPLHWAVGSGNLDIVKLLAPMMENIDAKNRFGETAAMIAEGDHKQAIHDVLIAHGAKIDSRNQ